MKNKNNSNFIMRGWRKIIAFRSSLSRFGKGLWDAFWYFFFAYLGSLLIFSLLFVLESKLTIGTVAWIAACVAAGIGLLIFLYVFFVEERPQNLSKLKKRKNQKSISLKDLEMNESVKTGQTVDISTNESNSAKVSEEARITAAKESSKVKVNDQSKRVFQWEDQKPTTSKKEEELDMSQIKKDFKNVSDDQNIDETLEA